MSPVITNLLSPEYYFALEKGKSRKQFHFLKSWLSMKITESSGRYEGLSRSGIDYRCQDYLSYELLWYIP